MINFREDVNKLASVTLTSHEPFKSYEDRRVISLRYTASLDTREESRFGPPYCPAPPSLARSEGYDFQSTLAVSDKDPSPLSTVVSSHPQSPISVRTRDRLRDPFPPIAPHTPSQLARMPHATSMPPSGFQALVLCGPGLGLNTFTTVPSDYPKALVSVANRPMLWYVLDWLYRSGVNDITVISPRETEKPIAAALAQNPYLTALSVPSPDLLIPKELTIDMPTAELLKLPEIRAAIKTDFMLLPCDLLCDISGEVFFETYFSNLSSLTNDVRKGGLSVWYNTANREESVKKEECDFMVSVSHPGKSASSLRRLATAMPMSEVDDNDGWSVRQSLMDQFSNVKCLTQYRDAHMYFFPNWVKTYASLNDFESVSEDLVGQWAQAQWRKPGYREKLGAKKIFSKSRRRPSRPDQINIEDEVDLISLSSTQTSSSTSQPASDNIPEFPSLLAYVHSSHPAAPLIRRIDTTALLLSTSLLIARMPTLEESIPPGAATSHSLLAAATRKAPSAIIEKSTTVSADSLLDANVKILTKVTIKNSCIGAGVTVNTNSRVTNSVVMENTTIGENCQLSGCIIGKNVLIADGSSLTDCEVQDGMRIEKGTEAKGEKFLAGGLDAAIGTDGEDDSDDNDDDDDEGFEKD